MHNCTQSRPSDHSSKSAPRLQTPPHFQSAGGYVGSASHYGGAPYGSSFYSGSPLPPYDLPAGGSGYPYAYGGRISVGSPYGPLHMSAPSPYSSGSMLGAGGIYGMPPVMDRYGMGMPMGHGPMKPYLLKRSWKKRQDTVFDSQSYSREDERGHLILQLNEGNNQQFRRKLEVSKCNNKTTHSGPSATGNTVALKDLPSQTSPVD
ncbi:RanBP2-type zinc finger protein [Platanthera guangdongensis]|uniref:RanBP2-type zinc finger protein n=1 Tax=Platanthera guangdongensis TaxID=2320717 RepID=A0ABR2MUY3_9ASPA